MKGYTGTIEITNFHENKNIAKFVMEIFTQDYVPVSIVNFCNDIKFDESISQPKSLEDIDIMHKRTLIIINPLSDGNGLPDIIKTRLGNSLSFCSNIPEHLFIIDKKIDKFEKWIKNMPLIKGMIILKTYDIDSKYFALEWEKKI